MALDGVALTLTDKHSEISGRVVADAAKLSEDRLVVVFPADRALWREGSRRIQSVRPGADGHYAFTDLPAGEYLVALAADADDWQRPARLEALVPTAVRVVVRDAEKTVQDINVR
jgi:hypothetical protein